MEESMIVQYFEGKTILITGATGFLAKILLEKILRVQPNVKKLFLLIRGTSKESIQQRLHEEVFSIELFRILREKCGEDLNHLLEKVIPVLGDVSHENLGVVECELRNEIWNEIDIIVNSAATTNFEERYDVALGINSLTSLHLKSFAGKCPRLKIFLHVSTAYVCGGTKTGLITENTFRMGETLHEAKIAYLDINVEKKIVEDKLRELQFQKATPRETTFAMKDLGTERALLHGWPNTYTFTKAIGEMFLENFTENVKLIIARPTIVTSTYKDPFPGWIEGVRTVDGIFMAIGKGNVKIHIGDPQTTLDMIPGDMVVNSMLTAMATHSSQPSSEILVYHIGSSLRNPLKYKDAKCLIIQYLKTNPLCDENGKPIQIRDPIVIESMIEFRRYIATHYLPYLKILKLINTICCNHFNNSYTNAKRKIDRTMRLAELYQPFTFFYGIFDDFNTETMRRSLGRSNVDTNMFAFDPICIQWEQYFMNTHFPGLVKHALKLVLV